MRVEELIKKHKNILKVLLSDEIRDEDIPESKIGEGKEYNWKTTETGKKILVNGNGEVVSGCGKDEEEWERYSKENQAEEQEARENRLDEWKLSRKGIEKKKKQLQETREYLENDEDFLGRVLRGRMIRVKSEVNIINHDRLPTSIEAMLRDERAVKKVEMIYDKLGDYVAAGEYIQENKIDIDIPDFEEDKEKILETMDVLKRGYDYIKKNNLSFDMDKVRQIDSMLKYTMARGREGQKKQYEERGEEIRDKMKGQECGIRSVEEINSYEDACKAFNEIFNENIKIGEEKKRYEEIRKLKSIDGGVKKGKAMNHDEADGGAVNPNYSRSKEDVDEEIRAKKPDYKSEEHAYHINCQTCVATYEARRQGYDVTAGPNDGENKSYMLAHNIKEAYINKDGTEVKWDIQEAEEKFVGDLVVGMRRYIENQYEDNARFVVEWNWSGYNSGHVVNVIKENGKMRMYDAQTNRNYNTDEEIERFWQDKNGNFRVREINVMRVDDKDLNPYYFCGENAIVKKSN